MFCVTSAVSPLCSGGGGEMYITLTIFKGTVKWHSVHSLLCTHHHHPLSELCHRSKEDRSEKIKTFKAVCICQTKKKVSDKGTITSFIKEFSVYLITHIF